MRHLLDLDRNSNIIIDPNLLSVEVFRKIWERDETEDKKKAHMDIGYIFWSIDFRSYVSHITDEYEKHREVVKLIDSSGEYEPDELVKDAIELYAKDLPFSVLILNDAKIAVNEIRKFFREVRLDERDRNGKPVYDASKIQNSIKTLTSMVEDLEKLESKVRRDMQTTSNARGDKKLSMYEE